MVVDRVVTESELREWLRQELPHGDQLELWERPLGGLPHCEATFRDALVDRVEELTEQLSRACWSPAGDHQDGPMIHALFLYGKTSDAPFKRVHVVAAIAEFSASMPNNTQTMLVESFAVSLLASQLPSSWAAAVERATTEVSKARLVLAYKSFERERGAWEREWA